MFPREGIIVAIFACCSMAFVENERAPIAKIVSRPENYPGQIRAVAKIINLQRMNRYSWREECYGAFIDFRLVLTACSCVSFTKDLRLDVTPWYQGNVTSVRPVFESNLKVGMMLFEFHPWRTTVAVSSVELHPACDSYYHVDYAILVLEERHPRAVPIFLNRTGSAELFKKQMSFLTVTTAMHDDCSVFSWVDRDGLYRLRQDLIKFQHWDYCVEHVCPVHSPVLPQKRPHLQNITDCQNEIKGSRHCLEWTADSALCSITSGSPLFCNFNGTRGVWGLVVNNRYTCPSWDEARGIVNGIDAAFDWIKEIFDTYKSISTPIIGTTGSDEVLKATESKLLQKTRPN